MTGPGLALFVPAYLVCAGILLYSAVTAALMAAHGRDARLYHAFAATCVLSSAATTTFAAYYMSETVAGAIAAQRWQSVTAGLLVSSIAVFIGVYTRARVARGWIVAWGLLAAAYIVFTAFVLPYGLRFARIDAFGRYVLPWGETISYLSGTPGLANWFYRAILLVFLVWAVGRLLAFHRQGGGREAKILAIYVIALVAATMQGALVDVGLLPPVHVVGFVLVGLALLMSYQLQMRLRDHTRELEAAAQQLREENARRSEAEARVRAVAFTDALTGLPSRIALQEHIAGLAARGPETAHGALLCCDLDHFKVVNDALSHDVGDLVLRETATRLAELARGRAFLARGAGDNFVAVLDGLCAAEGDARTRINELAGEFGRAMRVPFESGGHALHLSASIGVAIFPSRGPAPAEVLGLAEMALHLAKKQGRDVIEEFVPAMHRDASRRLAVVAGLRGALERGGLELHYQPQVDAAGRVVGAEALCRWSTAPLGAASPGVFIPIAEESGLIHALGEWSLREACERLARWSREATPFGAQLAVNVSPWQLARSDFVDVLRGILAASGADPHRLTLEITESAVLFDLAETVAKLRAIRSLGVQIALDDFGTGYSSLALIKDLPLDEIKIDQSFVRHLSESANRRLVRVMVDVGAELGVDVVAEGVETAAERDDLITLGCQRFQGYYFGAPMAEAAFLAWLRAGSTTRDVPGDRVS